MNVALKAFGMIELSLRQYWGVYKKNESDSSLIAQRSLSLIYVQIGPPFIFGHNMLRIYEAKQLVALVIFDFLIITDKMLRYRR